MLSKFHGMMVLALLGLLLAGCGLGADEAPATEEEAAAIYAAVIRQIYTEDDTFGGTLQPPTLYVVTETDDTVGDPDTEALEPATISPAVQAAVETRLADLNTELAWVASQQEVSLDPQTGEVEGGGGIITLGNLHREGDTFEVPASIYVAGLAAGGQTYVLEMVDGAWTVTGNTGAQWIS